VADFKRNGSLFFRYFRQAAVLAWNVFGKKGVILFICIIILLISLSSFVYALDNLAFGSMCMNALKLVVGLIISFSLNSAAVAAPEDFLRYLKQETNSVKKTSGPPPTFPCRLYLVIICRKTIFTIPILLAMGIPKMKH